MGEVDEPDERDYETVAWLINYRHAPSEERAEMRTAFVREFLSRGDASQTDKAAFNQHLQEFFRGWATVQERSAFFLAYYARQVRVLDSHNSTRRGRHGVRRPPPPRKA